MKRRNFLRSVGALSIPALLNNGVAGAPLQLFTQFINPDSDKVLVLIRLAGGNDSLNTLIGTDQIENLRIVRPNIALPDSGIIDLTPETGLHSAMTGMKTLFDEGKLGAVQAVGYPNQNRSHFRSTDIWTSASDADEVITTGWLGRYLENDHPEYPTGYPSTEYTDPLAMTMGTVISETCQGTSSNFSVAVNNPFNYLYIAPGGDTPLPVGTNYGTEVDFVRTLIGQSNEYGEVVQNAANAGNSLADNYTTGRLSKQLRDIAYLISGGLKTKVYVATLTGFDTHSAQVNDGDRLTGRHAELMTELSDSIKAFQDDLEALGLADRVMGMTFSEFGRRIKDNASNGSDHGDAGSLFVFGNCVAGGITGTNPVIDTEVDQITGVPYQYDFRDVYGSVLMDWFDVPETTVQNLVYPGFQYLPIFNGCNLSLPVDLMSITARGLTKSIKVEWSTSRETDNAGFVVERSEDGRNFRAIGRVRPGAQGNSINEYSFEDTDVRLGALYYYRLRQEDLSGSFEYSPIQTARLRGTAKGDWAVGLPRPNPVRSDSYLKVYAPVDSTANFEVFDVRGQRLRTGTVTLPGGVDTRVALRPGGLAPGTYVYRLRTADGKVFSRKFIKQ
ncbi:DUF1501 domain-containing protein [Lewinella sp. 4G2]|uniref:DUF1501 domain-containing protein n=1 Tax=Lewinella sp. 4G2 TaxID=1803372 RepID=UPI0007B47335|nr:DUF1501 domain-containing protein [Lewinella sp. 4G2]OAV45026.1 hypothetical protein A3850_011245 [Lewinella sp. 4G2]